MTAAPDGRDRCYRCSEYLPEIIYAPQSPLNAGPGRALNRWCLPFYEGRIVHDTQRSPHAMFPVCELCHDNAMRIAP